MNKVILLGVLLHLFLLLKMLLMVLNGTNKKADYNWIRGNNGQDTDKAVRVLLLGGYADNGSKAGSDGFYSFWVRSDSHADVGFFTTIKLD